MIDTHCHLYLEEFDETLEQVLQRAEENSVEKFYLPAIDSKYTERMLSLEKRYPGRCFAMMGLHPCYVKENYIDELSGVEHWLRQRKFSAIGEIGLDKYWDQTFLQQQYDTFRKQVEWAIEFNLPVVIHSRQATRECIDVISEFRGKGLTGIFHCFGGTKEEAEAIISLGFYLGIGGVVTYKNSGLDKVLAGIDMSHIVLETDAPYLSPVPHRGKVNESSFLTLIAEKIATIYATSIEEVDRVTTRNALNVFK